MPQAPLEAPRGYGRGEERVLSVECAGSRCGIRWRTHGRIDRQAHWPHMQTNVLARALELPIVGFPVCTDAE